MSHISISATVIDAVEWGIRADGVSDDGPVIRQMLEAARKATGQGAVTLRFPAGSRIYAATAPTRHLFRLDDWDGLTIDGQGSVFLLHPQLRFLFASNCSNLVLKRLKVDMTPSPTVEAVVLDANPDGSRLIVRLDEPGRASELGGPTGQDGEQAFFGMLWLPGEYTDYSYHYYVAAVEPVAAVDGTGQAAQVEVIGTEPMPAQYRSRMVNGETRISLPVPGVAHRHGPGAMIIIDRSSDVSVQEVEIWSAPWFAYQVFRNRGSLVFRGAHIRPQPGSGRITSTWRDGFHVKGNAGMLLFEDCILEGMNDDAFNVSTHTWKVARILAPDRFVIQQRFPLQFMPPLVGGSLQAISADGQLRLGESRILTITGADVAAAIYYPGEGDRHPRAPELEIVVEKPIKGLSVGAVVWDATNANPTVVIRNCIIRNSCRFQSPVVLEYCDVAAFLWFYGNELEGPLPSGSIVRHNILKRGRGNPQLALSFLGELHTDPRAPRRRVPLSAGQFPLSNITLEGNRIYGHLGLDRVHGVTVSGNVMVDGLDAIELRDSIDVRLENNRTAGH